MAATFQIFLILLAVLAGTALLARRLDVAPAILLLLAGIALAFVPSMPSLELPPELVLLLVLPPLIYSASVAMSWREFKFNLRPIVLLAVGCVIFTAIAVAAATHYVMGLPWSIGFLLGAIVPALLAELQGADAPLSPARRIARLTLAGLLTLAVPTLAIALWKTKTILAMLAGLAFSGVLRGPGTSADRTEAAGRASLITTVFALGIALAIAQWTGHAAAISTLSRHEKMLVVRGTVVALVVLIAGLDIVERLRARRPAPSAAHEAAEGGTAR